MTYYDNQTRYGMEWPDRGLEISATASSMAALLAAEKFQRRQLAGKPSKGKHLAELARVFVAHVVRWDIRHGETGRPVPVSFAAFMALDREEVVLPALREWVGLVLAGPAAGVEAGPAAEQVVEDPFDPGALLEARSLQDPGPGEQLVDPGPAEPLAEPVPALVTAG